MEKTKDAVKRMLKEQYKKACNAYVVELARMWEWDVTDYGYWVGEDVGGCYMYGEFYAMSMDEIIYCVEHDIESDDYLRYSDYCAKCHEYNFNVLPLKAWHEGAPIVPQETFDRLDALKRNLEEEINNVKEQFWYGKQVSGILPYPHKGAGEEKEVRHGV